MSGFCLGLLGMVALSLVCPQQAKALDSQYLRNGECYLLIGEGNENLRGVYRLNNPAANPVKYYEDNQVIKGKDIKDTLGFNVDLYRNIYTFTEVVDSKFKLADEKLVRQVVDDNVTADASDYGYHSYIHADHRGWGAKTDVYRTSRKDGNVKSSGGGTWSGFKSAGPGEKLSGKPKGFNLPEVSSDSDDAAKCGEFSDRDWYEIPNGSWYSTWKQGTCENGKSKFYMVYGEKLEVKNHDYKLWTWTPENAEKDTPVYSKDVGSSVAETREEKFTRNVLAGCLDGCGSAKGNGSVDPKPMHNDIAFQPPLKDQPKRTYFYSRTEGSSSAKVTKDKKNYKDNIIGLPNSDDTYWLCISLKDASSDYVYCLGTKAINEWYKQVYGSYQSGMDITAVTVSNQWNQEGGIVYAYDKGNKKIYKFERKESEGTPVSSERFLSIDVASITEKIGAISNSEFDDIKADGFGSLYLALSHPSKKTKDYNPANHFKPSDCIHLHPTVHDSKKGEQDFEMIYKQDYGKKVFERNYLTGDIKLIGSKNYATVFYNVSCKIKDAGWNIIKNYNTGGISFNTLNATLATYSASVNGSTYKTATNNWKPSYYKKGLGGCTCYKELSYTDPGHAKLAVINVPTPPRVISLGDKKSYLDIVGPYAGGIPPYDKENRTTNQGDGLLPTNNLNIDELYFYMVENYPLEDGAQDPTLQPNWDNDGRMGGFITSLQDPAPYGLKSSSHPNGVQYEWKTWMVMDLYGNCVCKLSQKVDAKDGNPYNFIYSPVAGKFIMTCRVKYNWYNYDDLPFGSTVKDLKDVLHTDEFAIPVSSSGIYAEWASDRLTQIKNSFKYKGPNTDYKEIFFMNNPIDQNGKSISVDYSPIVADENGGKYLALEPISIGDIGTMPPPPDVVFPITRCDDIPNVATSTYMNNDSFWSKVPSDDKTFGIAAGEVYNWRIDKDAQEYMFKNISKYNSTNPNDKNYNYLAHQMITPGTGFYVNKKANFKFKNDLGDLRWSDKKILVSAKLLYKVPGDPNYKTMPLKQAQDKTSASVGSDYEFEYEVKDETTLWQKNIPVYYTTAGNLPPTDPMDAKIQITMRRQYNYDMWAYDKDSQPSFQVSNLPGWFKVTGEAKIRIIDTTKPKVAWSETKPNNLFGITGGDLVAGVGPNGKTNPKNINFTVTDNNPWEAVETQTGLTLDEHIKNISYNYGYAYCETYCSKNPYLKERFKKIKPSNVNGIRNDIESKKKRTEPTSGYNYKSLFSRQARDVRLGFETVCRDKITGKVKLDKADNLYKITGRDFLSENATDYAIHYRSGDGHNSKYQKSLSISSMSYYRTVGATTVYDSTMVYSLPINTIKIGTNNSGGISNKIPDGYANNTPGYRIGKEDIRPYKFFVSLTDSSGNYTGEKELNVVLNVKDDIPPIGYGSVYDSKYKKTSYFPYETSSTDFSEDSGKAPSYRISGEDYYFSQVLNSNFLRGTSWASNDANGFVKGNNVAGPYKSMIPLGDKIQTSLQGNTVFMTQVKNKICPQAVEDNVECKFNVYVSDNCGNANATLYLNYFETDGRNGGQPEITKNITCGWSSAADVNGATDLKVASSTCALHTLFRGNSGQFPMAIPIKIVSQDDARDWDYYTGFNEDGAGGWKWGTVHFGAKANNTRTFKTSLPVFGSELDIRTLDKSMQNK